MLVVWALLRMVRTVARKSRGYISKNRRLILLALYGVSGWWGALELSRVTGISAGSIYPLLTEAEQKGWLTHSKETPLPTDRPARTFYRVTDEGKHAIYDLLQLDKQARLRA